MQERRYKGIFNPLGYPDIYLIYLQEAGGGKIVNSYVRPTQFRNEKLSKSLSENF